MAAEACFEAGREDYGMPVASARLETYKHRLQNLLDSYAISIVSTERVDGHPSKSFVSIAEQGRN